MKGITTREQAVEFLKLIGVNHHESAGTVDKADALLLVLDGKPVPQEGDKPEKKGGGK